MTDNDLPLGFLFLLSGSSSGEQLVTTVRETRRLSSHDVVFHSLLFFAIFVLFAIYLCCFLHTFTMFESNVRLLHSRRLMTGSALVRYAWESVDWMLCTLLIISAEISQWTKCLMLCFFSLLFSEIARVRASLFQINGVRKEPLQLPEPDGETVTLNEKVYVPVKEHPDVSFVFLLFVW